MGKYLSLALQEKVIVTEMAAKLNKPHMISRGTTHVTLDFD